MPRNSKQLNVKVKDVLAKVCKVKAHVHRMSFTMDYDMAKRVYWTFYKQAHKVAHEGAWGWYRDKVVLWTYHGKLTLFYGKTRPMPDVTIQTADSSPKLLKLMGNIAPDMLVSNVEYSVDLMVEGPMDVAGVFWALRRNAYFPRWTGEIHLIGDTFDSWDDTPEINRVHKVHRAGTKRSIKFYERGPDDKKVKDIDDMPFWWREDLDRVRIEVTVGRSDQINGKKVLSGISEFTAKPGIHDVIGQNVRFKSFSGANMLPCEFDRYEALDDSGYDQCFQAEFRAAKELVQNPSQYMQDVSSIGDLRQRMLNAAKKVDLGWKKGIAKPVG